MSCLSARKSSENMTTDQIDNARVAYAALLESSLKRVVTVLSGLEGVRRISLVGDRMPGARRS